MNAPPVAVATKRIEDLDIQLTTVYRDRMTVDLALSRQTVSFQANKARAAYRWYKYKEAFSASLVEYLMGKYGCYNGILLDPFAGSGTALFAASAQGLAGILTVR